MYSPGTMGFRGPMGLMGMGGMGSPALSAASGIQEGIGLGNELMEQPLRMQMLQNQVQEQQRRQQWELQDRDYQTSGRDLEAADANRQALYQQAQSMYRGLPRAQDGSIDTTKLTPDQQDQIKASKDAADQAQQKYMQAFHSHYGQDFVDLNKSIKKDMTSLQTGQMNWADMPADRAYVALGAATGGDLSAYMRNPQGQNPVQQAFQNPAAATNPNAQNPVNLQGGKSQIENAIDLVSHGVQNNDQGALVRGANVLLKPMLDRGVGLRQPNGITTQKQELIGFVPGKGGGDSMLPIVKITGTTDDGRTVSYTAGVPTEGDHGPDAMYTPHSMHEWMDYLQKQRQMVDIVNHPEVMQKLQEGAKDQQAQATLSDWKRSYDIFGKGGIDQLPKGKYKIQNTDLGDVQQQDVLDEESGNIVNTRQLQKGVNPTTAYSVDQRAKSAAQPHNFKDPTALKAWELKQIEDDQTLSEDEKADARMSILSGIKPKAAPTISTKEATTAAETQLRADLEAKGWHYDDVTKSYSAADGTPLPAETYSKLHSQYVNRETPKTKAAAIGSSTPGGQPSREQAQQPAGPDPLSVIKQKATTANTPAAIDALRAYGKAKGLNDNQIDQALGRKSSGRIVQRAITGTTQG